VTGNNAVLKSSPGLAEERFSYPSSALNATLIPNP
jgi:hypothetical protein